jgi:hypothetical protein
MIKYPSLFSQRIALVFIIFFFINVSILYASEMPNGYGGVTWQQACPSNFKVMMEDTVRGQKFQMAVNPKASATFGGVSFDQVVYRFIDDKLAMVSFVKSGADVNWYQSKKSVLETNFGKPSQVINNQMMDLFQTYWKSEVSMGCFEWNEGNPEDGEPESVSFTLTPAMSR